MKVGGRDVLLIDSPARPGAGPIRVLVGELGMEGTLRIEQVQFIYVWPRLVRIHSAPQVLDLDSAVGERAVTIERVMAWTGSEYEEIRANVPYTIDSGAN